MNLASISENHNIEKRIAITPEIAKKYISLGFNLSAYYKFLVMENVEMENILALYGDYLSKVGNFDVDYQVNLRFKVNKTIKMLLTLHMLVDDDASSRIQFRQLFGLGLNYNFHDKTVY